jgi:hypothetical protein
MENTNSTNGHPFTDKVKVDLHVLSALMLNRVGGEVDGADVVAVDEGGGLQVVVKLLKKLLQPHDFGDSVGDGAVFGLGAGPRDRGLPLG